MGIDTLARALAASAINYATMMTRAQALTAYNLPATFITSGFLEPGDLGEGATYTSYGATSSGPMAFENNGIWYQLVVHDYIKAGWFGAKGDWNGTTGTDDTVALQAAINFAVKSGTSYLIPGFTLEFEAAVFKITSPLVIGDTSVNYYAGFRIIGAGRGSTSIFMEGQPTATVTMTMANPCVVSWTTHGLVAGTAVSFTSSVAGGLYTGVTASTIYYEANDGNLTTGTFAFSDTYAHAIAGTGQITTSGSTSGTITAISPQLSIVTWKGNAWRDAYFGDLTLDAGVRDGTQYGIYNDSSQTESLIFNNFRINRATTAIHLDVGSGSNGEFMRFSNFYTYDILNFFYSNAGQGFSHLFDNGFIYRRAQGGILWDLEPTVVGGGIHIQNVSSTAYGASGITGSTIFKIAGNHNKPITVVGGRFEEVTCIFDIAVSAHGNTQISLVGTTFVTDWVTGTSTPAGVLWIENGDSGNGHKVLFQGCDFESSAPSDSTKYFTTWIMASSRALFKFSQCQWINYQANPTLTNQSTWPQIQVFLCEQCSTLMYNGTLTYNWAPTLPTTVIEYSTNSSTSASTVLAGSDIYGGYPEHVLDLTGAITVASNAQLPTVSNLTAAIGNAFGNQSLKLRVKNSGGTGSGVWTIITNSNWTLNGNMAISPNTYTDFIIKLNSSTGTAILQNIG